MRYPLAISILAFAALTAGPGPRLLAQTPRSGGGEQQKMMQQYQQLAAEKTALQAQVTKGQSDLAAAQSELAAVKKERDSLKTRAGATASAPPAVVERLTAAKETAERNLEQNKARTTELVDKFRQIALSLKEAENDRTKLRADLSERNTQFDKCAADNLQLYDITNEVLDRLEHVGLFTRIGASEPVTKITRVRIDNLVDEYRERAQASRAKKPSP